MDFKKFALLISYFLLPVPLIVAFYYETLPEYRTGASIGLSAIGIIAYVWFCFEFVLMARPKLLDRTFGMDKITKFHIRNSIFMVILSILHARLLRVRDLSYNATIKLGSSALTFYMPFILLGFIFMLNTKLDDMKIYFKIKGFFINKLRMRYHFSKFVHNLTMVATVFLYGHIMRTSSTQNSLVLQILYSVYFFAGFLIWINHKFIWPIRIKKFKYEIIDVVQETRDIWTLVLKPIGTHRITFKAGQYCYLTLDAPGFSKEPHPFSFSSGSHTKEQIKRL